MNALTDPLDFSGRTVLVIGGSSGIGNGIAQAFRSRGAVAIPLKRLGEPADMAGVALFLASPLAAYVLGHTLVVDGGLTLS